MFGGKRGKSLKSLDAIDSASVQQGASDHAGGGSVKRWLDALPMVSEYRHERQFITGFHRLTTSVPLLDSAAYALKPIVWSEFDLWHGVCTCLL